MLKFDTSTIHEDVCNWTQTAEELRAWTVETMKKELTDIFGVNKVVHEHGEEITIEELAKLYTEEAHALAEELE